MAAGHAHAAPPGESPPQHAAGGVGWLMGSTPPEGNGVYAGGAAGSSPGGVGGPAGGGAAAHKVLACCNRLVKRIFTETGVVNVIAYIDAPAGWAAHWSSTHALLGPVMC